jgi:hypothetical protein
MDDILMSISFIYIRIADSRQLLNRPNGNQTLLPRDRIAYAAAVSGSMSLSEARLTSPQLSRLIESEVSECQVPF